MFVLLLLVSVLSRDVSSSNLESVIDAASDMARCRSSCLEQFGGTSSPLPLNYYGGGSNEEAAGAAAPGCTTKANWKCNMCWDYCETLSMYQTTRIEMCNDDICMEGCKYACGFQQHLINENSTPKSPATAAIKLFEPKVTSSRVSWGFQASQPTKVVFGLYALRYDNTWIELLQTTEQKFVLTQEDTKLYEFAIAAFTKDGLQKLVRKKTSLRIRQRRSAADVYYSELQQLSHNNLIAIAVLFAVICALCCVACFLARQRRTVESQKVFYIDV